MKNERENDNEIRMTESLIDRFREWRLAMSVDGDLIAKALVCFALVIFFSLLQTTLFARYRPFGAVPDLILPLIIAISMTEREKWGAVFGLFGAFVIESIGGSHLTLLPLLYMPTGYICGLLTVYRFRDSPPVRGIYTLVGILCKGFFTVLAIYMTVGDVSLPAIFTEAVLPELCSTAVFAAVPHAAAYFALRAFNRTREARVR